jgi:hypothetical protein
VARYSPFLEFNQPLSFHFSLFLILISNASHSDPTVMLRDPTFFLLQLIFRGITRPCDKLKAVFWYAGPRPQDVGTPSGP